MTQTITVKTYRNAFNTYEASVKYQKGRATVMFRKSDKDYDALCKAVLANIRVEAEVVFDYLGDRLFVD